MKQWFDEAGESPSSNWFKDHPHLTLGMLVGCIIIIVIVSV